MSATVDLAPDELPAGPAPMVRQVLVLRQAAERDRAALTEMFGR